MKIIEEVTKEQLKEQLKNIDLTDQNLYKEVNNNQFGIFQFSGNTASGMIKEAKVNNFNDLVSINALSRPGASFGFNDFCNNIDGKSKYPEQISKYLKDSRGCILFQEQIMNITYQLSNGYENKTNSYIDEKKGLEKNVKYISIKTDNGTLELLPNEEIETTKGIKKAKDLDKNDIIVS